MPDKVSVVVTESPTSPADATVLKTKTGESNIEVITMQWWVQVLIRVGRTYAQGVVGFLVAGSAGLPGPLPASGFMNVMLNAASLAVAPAVVSLLQNAVEILSKLDASNPQLRA